MQKATYTLILLVSLLTATYTSNAQYVFENFDINPKSGSYPNGVTVIDTFLYFTADHDSHGREPWISDGSKTGTQLIKDIITGKQTTTGAVLGSVNGKVLFLADDYSHGHEPWITDGTANGTQMIKDIYTGSPASINTNRPYSYSTGTELYFTPDDGPNGTELWVTDGTANGTKLVKDINPGTGNSQPAFFTEYNGKVYFVANDGTHGAELWVTDGTANGTNMVIDLSPGSAAGYVYHLTVYNNKLYFAGYYNTKYGLIETDGTANGTKMVKEVAISNQTSLYDIRIVQFNGKMYFPGSDTSSTGTELWVSDGTTNGTYMLKDINPLFAQSSTPENLTVVGNQLFFTADDGTHKEELWVTDGTANGTRMVKDINPNPKRTDPISLMAYGNKLYFGARDTNGRTAMWVSDGTTNGTKMIKGYDPVTKFTFQGNYVVCNDALYFAGYDYDTGHELWKMTDTTLNNPPTHIPTKTVGNIQIAPNPAHDKVTLTLDKEYKKVQVTITDLSGKTILKQAVTRQRNIEVALPDIPTGVYLINLQHSEGVLTERLLIE